MMGQRNTRQRSTDSPSIAGMGGASACMAARPSSISAPAGYGNPFWSHVNKNRLGLIG